MALRMISSAKERKRWRGEWPDVGQSKGWRDESGGSATNQERPQRTKCIRSGAAVGNIFG